MSASNIVEHRHPTHRSRRRRHRRRSRSQRRGQKVEVEAALEVLAVGVQRWRSSAFVVPSFLRSFVRSFVVAFVFHHRIRWFVREKAVSTRHLCIYNYDYVFSKYRERFNTV